jgi:hypothetical protein
MDFVIDKDARIYNISISNKYEYSYFDEHENYLRWRNSITDGIYIKINNIITTFIPFQIKANLTIPKHKEFFERHFNGKNINYLNNNYSLEKSTFKYATLNEILNMDVKITNFDDLAEFYNKIELLGYIKFLYEPDRNGILKKTITFCYTELFINKILNYYSAHNIIKIKYNHDFNYINRICKEGVSYNQTRDINHNINIITIQSKVIKKKYKLYDSIEEFIKDKKIDTKYKIHQLEPLLIEEIQDDNLDINLLDLTVDEKTKNTETELIDL